MAAEDEINRGTIREMYSKAQYLRHAFLLKSLFFPASQAHICRNAAEYDQEEQSLLQKCEALLDNCIAGRCHDGRNLRRLRVGDGDFSDGLRLSGLELRNTVEIFCGEEADDQRDQQRAMPRAQAEKRKVLYSSTWIPSSGTGSSPLFVILTSTLGLSPIFCTSSIFCTIS